MRHELFIDNKKVDLSPSTNINLTYKSNLLSELDKITSSYSYTIKLPKTKRNMELIEGCNIPSNNSSFAYLPHRARLLRDGIEIVRDAVVVLLSVGDDIQISLTWGNVSALATFLETGKTLQDLDLGSITWTTAITEQTPNANYGNNGTFYQPVVKISDILNGINTESIKLSVKDFYKINNLVIPCVDAQAKQTEFPDDAIILNESDNNQIVKTGSRHLYFSGVTGNSFIGFTNTGGNYQDTSSIDTITPLDKAVDIIIKGKLQIRHGRLNTQENPSVISDFEIRGSGGYSVKPYYKSKWNNVVLYYFNIDYLIPYEQYNEEGFSLYIPEEFTYPYDMFISKGEDSTELTLTPITNSKEPVTPDKGDVNYPLSSNMPDISQIDFLKGIMSMMGWYAEPMEGDSGVWLLPYSTVSDNKSKAIDWSDKLVNRRIEPSDIEFRMSDMAQKNYFRYADDDTVTGDYDGYITVDDKTLEAWKDAVTLPFAATDAVDGLPYIPLYSFNEDGEMEINDSLTPRILIQEGTTLKFEGLQWNKLIQANWQAYQDIILRPKIITEQVRLNAIDLKQIDMTIPVYISQYGSHFAILEIKTKNDDICDVQLLKI